jgi:hypothetical protein
MHQPLHHFPFCGLLTSLIAASKIASFDSIDSTSKLSLCRKQSSFRRIGSRRYKTFHPDLPVFGETDDAAAIHSVDRASDRAVLRFSLFSRS